MKRCKKCGQLSYEPKDKCMMCGTKYDDGYDCDPLSASTKDNINDGYYTSGDPNARHNKDD